MIERPVAEEWLGKRSETQWSFTNAYVGIEQRAEAIRQLSPRINQQDNEPNGQRWASEDATAIKWVRSWEVHLALAAIVRSKDLNRGYAAEIHKHESLVEAVLQEALEADNSGRGPTADREHAGPFVGAILSMDERTVTQRVGRGGATVQHAVADLTRPVSVGETAEIVYRGGRAVVSEREMSPSRGVGH